MFDKSHPSPRDRAEDFTHRLGIRLPILLAPMAGACPPSLSIAVANAGGLGACGALLMKPDDIRAWGSAFREGSAGEFQINLWIPQAPPVRDFDLEKRQRPRRTRAPMPLLRRAWKLGDTAESFTRTMRSGKW